MESLEFTLKLLSPAFIGGAMEEEVNHHGKKVQHRIINEDGLRIPSLRGIFRFWFRAMNATLTLKTLREAENHLFGSTESGQGIKIIPKGQSADDPVSFGQNEKCTPAEIYLGYGPIAWDKFNRKATTYNPNMYRDAFPAGKEFYFKVVGTNNQLEQIISVLRLLHLFGGIGSRSRRAWGSIGVLLKDQDFLPTYTKQMKITDWFKTAINKVWNGNVLPSLVTALPKYSAFSHNTLIGISKNSWEYKIDSYKHVFNFFYSHFHKIRNHEKGSIGYIDHQNEVADYKTSTFNHVPKRIAFGMPYQTLSSKNDWGLKFKGIDSTDNDNKIERRASPLFLKVFHAPNDKLYSVALFLKSSFFGSTSFHFEAEKRTNKTHNVFVNMKGSQPFPGWLVIENEFMQKNVPDTNPNKLWNSIAVP